MPTENRPLPRTSPDVVWTTVADGAVLYSTSRELYYGVNSVAAYVWEQLPPRTESFEALCAAVQARFPEATADQIRADVHELLDDFARFGLVEAVAEAS